MFALRMKIKLIAPLFLALVLYNEANAQLGANLKQHISFLASDSLHGRMTGSADERVAANYIIDQFKKAGGNQRKGKLQF